MAQLYEDFASQAVDAFPAGFTSRWTDTNHTPRVRTKTGATGGKAFEHVATVGAHRVFSYDAAGSIANAEALTKLQFSGSLSGNQHGAIVRASSLGNGYICFPFNGAFRLGKLTAGSYSEAAPFGTLGVTMALDTWYWIRLRVNGTTVQAKVWADGSAEPDWQKTATDSAHTTGYVGAFAYSNTFGTRYWDLVAVGTNGDSAPSSAPSLTVAADSASVTVGASEGAATILAQPTVLDTFTRADAASLGMSDSGHAWSVGGVTWGISANQANFQSATSSGAEVARVDAGASDCTIECDIKLASGTRAAAGIGFRWASQDNHFWALIQRDTGIPLDRVYVSKLVAGAETVLGIYSPASLVAGQTYQLKVVLSGADITVFLDGVQVITASDVFNQTATVHGLAMYRDSSGGSDDGTSRWDNFTVAAAASPFSIAADPAGLTAAATESAATIQTLINIDETTSGVLVGASEGASTIIVPPTVVASPAAVAGGTSEGAVTLTHVIVADPAGLSVGASEAAVTVGPEGPSVRQGGAFSPGATMYRQAGSFDGASALIKVGGAFQPVG